MLVNDAMGSKKFECLRSHKEMQCRVIKPQSAMKATHRHPPSLIDHWVEPSRYARNEQNGRGNDSAQNFLYGSVASENENTRNSSISGLENDSRPIGYVVDQRIAALLLFCAEFTPS